MCVLYDLENPFNLKLYKIYIYITRCKYIWDFLLSLWRGLNKVLCAWPLSTSSSACHPRTRHPIPSSSLLNSSLLFSLILNFVCLKDSLKERFKSGKQQNICFLGMIGSSAQKLIRSVCKCEWIKELNTVRASVLLTNFSQRPFCPKKHFSIRNFWSLEILY